MSLWYPGQRGGSKPPGEVPAGVAPGCNPSGGSVHGLCVEGVGPSFSGADPAPTSRWRSPLLPHRREGQLGRWCKAYRLRLETEQGKVFAVISEAITWVNRGLDHPASCAYGTCMCFCLCGIQATTGVQPPGEMRVCRAGSCSLLGAFLIPNQQVLWLYEILTFEVCRKRTLQPDSHGNHSLLARALGRCFLVPCPKSARFVAEVF